MLRSEWSSPGSVQRPEKVARIPRSRRCTGDNVRHNTLWLFGYHADDCTKNLNLKPDELAQLGGIKIVATSATRVLKEYLRAQPDPNRHIEGRLSSSMLPDPDRYPWEPAGSDTFFTSRDDK